LYKHHSANRCASVDCPDGHTHHQYPSSQQPPEVTAATTPHTIGPEYEAGESGPFVVANNRKAPGGWATVAEANPPMNAAHSHLPLLAL
jgi:hypothetical protein